MNEVIRKLNDYFFGEEDITLSDGIWFYGVAISVPVIILLYVIGG